MLAAYRRLPDWVQIGIWFLVGVDATQAMLWLIFRSMGLYE